MLPTISTSAAAGTFTEYAPTATTARETVALVHVTGAASEVMGPAVVNTVHKEQVVAGSVSQNMVEIPTVHDAVQVQEIPKAQAVEKVEGIAQKFRRPVEQIIKQTVEVPKIFAQERMQQRTVEQVIDVPVPQTVEKVVEVAKIIDMAPLLRGEQPKASLATPEAVLTLANPTSQPVNPKPPPAKGKMELEVPARPVASLSVKPAHSSEEPKKCHPDTGGSVGGGTIVAATLAISTVAAAP